MTIFSTFIYLLGFIHDLINPCPPCCQISLLNLLYSCTQPCENPALAAPINQSISIEWLKEWLNKWLLDWLLTLLYSCQSVLIDWLIDWKNDCMIDWKNDCMIACSPFHFPVLSPVGDPALAAPAIQHVSANTCFYMLLQKRLIGSPAAAKGADSILKKSVKFKKYQRFS